VLKQSLLVLAALSVAAFASGCGGAKDVAEVKSCLKDLKLNVDSAGKTDKKVEEGVFATSDLTKGDAKDITIAVAARVKKDGTVKEFEKDNTAFADQLKKSERGKDLKVESGTEGRYVWVVMGDASNDTYKKAKDCVEA
jgi:hypothetical protein